MSDAIEPLVNFEAQKNYEEEQKAKFERLRLEQKARELAEELKRRSKT